MPELNIKHPAIERLTAFGLGHLSESESKEIELHLADCEECRMKVVDVPADSLVHLLQASAADTHNGLASPSADTDSSAASKPSAAPLYKKLAQIIGGKDESADSFPRQSPGVPAARPDFVPPRALDGHARYLVLAPLGAGGMGTVFKAQHRLMDRMVALKIVNPLLVNRPGAAQRFEREVKAAAKLVHPNIVTAFDAEKVDDMHILVMEFVEGQTLAELLAARRELPVVKACDYVRQTAVGLQHALERGMVHRDIKPQNLMLTNKGEIKILDFGLARFVSEEGPAGASTEHGVLMGSPDYMAPEQGHDAHSADARADIYSMGCTLYHLLAGLVPFPGASLLAKLEAHRDKQPLSLHHVRSDVPLALSKVVEKMMAKEPAQRYQTPAEVAEALAPFTQPAVPATGPKARERPAPAFRPPVLGLVIAALLLLAPIGYFFGPAVYRFATNQGVVIIETSDDDIEVVVKNGGKLITIIDRKSGNQATLEAGQYEIELAKGNESFTLSTSEFVLRRGGTEVVRVRREPPVASGSGAGPKSPADDRGIISVEELLKTRKVLTVAQDGSGAYQTIQAALDAVQEGEVILVTGQRPKTATGLCGYVNATDYTQPEPPRDPWAVPRPDRPKLADEPAWSRIRWTSSRSHARS